MNNKEYKITIYAPSGDTSGLNKNIAIENIFNLDEAKKRLDAISNDYKGREASITEITREIIKSVIL